MMPGSLAPFTLLGHRCEVMRAAFGSERFDRHVHDVFSIGLVASGANVFSYRQKTVEAPAGTVCVADPGEVHDGGLSGQAWSYTNLFAPAEMIDAVLVETGVGGCAATGIGCVADPRVAGPMSRLFDGLIHGEGAEADEVALETLVNLFTAAGVRPAPPPPPEDAIAVRAIAAIRDARGLDVTLTGLARDAGTDRYRVVRSVHRMLGVTPMAYALHLRVAEAKRMILAGEPIAQAATAAGFSDQAHLTRRMKRVLGVTPGRLVRGRRAP